jgi:hypothetical protein
VGVEKLRPAKIAEMKLRQAALSGWTFSIPQILAVSREWGVFQPTPVLYRCIFEPRGSGELGLAPRSKVDRVEHNTKQIRRNQAQLPCS